MLQTLSPPPPRSAQRAWAPGAHPTTNTHTTQKITTFGAQTQWMMEERQLHEEPLKALLLEALDQYRMDEFFELIDMCGQLEVVDADLKRDLKYTESRFNANEKDWGNRVILQEYYQKERNGVLNSLRLMTSRIPEEITVTLNEEQYANLSTSNYKLTAEEIRRTIANYTKSYGFKAGIALLGYLEIMTRAIRQLDEAYQHEHWNFNHQSGDVSLEDWLNRKAELQLALENSLQDIKLPTDEKELKQLTRRLILENESPTLPQPELYFLLFPEAEAIEDLTDDAASQVDVPRYRRLLHLAQNAYKIGDYDQAYAYCQEILRDIYPESPQLYEYLLLNFRQIKHKQDIVQQALNGDDRDLKQLFVYVGRMKSLDQPKQSVQKSLRQKTIHEIADFLAIGLQQAVQEVAVNGLWLPPDATQEEAENRQKVSHYIDIGSQITRYTDSRPAIINALVNELAGGGRFAWITVGADYGTVINKRNFPALSHFHNLRGLTDAPEARADQATQVRNNLIRLHDELRARRTRQHLPEYFAYTARWVARCTTAYFLFEGDRSFLQLAYDTELTAADGLEWLELDDNGQLVARPVTWQHEQLDATKVFDFVVKTLFGDDGWKDRRRALERLVSDRLEAAIVKEYKRIKAGEYPDEATGRRHIVRCIRHWRTLFRATHRIHYVEHCILPELLGAGVYPWFSANVDDEDQPLVPIDIPGFSPRAVLDEMLGYTVLHDENSVQRELAANGYYHGIQPQYQDLAPFHEDAEEQRQALLDMMEETLWLYTLNAQSDMLQFCYDELIGEQKYPWLAIDADGLSDGDTWYGPQALDLAQRLSDLGTPLAGRYEWDAMLQTLGKSRYRQLERSYKEDFDDLRRHNWRTVDRLQMVRLLQDCVTLYRATHQVQFLFHPYREWVEHSGKIRWRWRFLFLQWERRQNHEIGNFHYPRERAEVLEALSMYSKHHLPWSGKR